MRRAFLSTTMTPFTPQTQPYQRSRIPRNPPIRINVNPPPSPAKPERWQLVYLKRAKCANKMQEVIKWRLINFEYNSK